MRKDLNNGSCMTMDHAKLPKAGILRGRKQFERLFVPAAKVYHERHISMRYYLPEQSKINCQMGFIVAKRLGKAVDRNYVKRVLKEAYRLNNRRFLNTLQTTNTSFRGAFMAKTLDLDFQTAQKEVKTLMGRFINKRPVEIEV